MAWPLRRQKKDKRVMLQEAISTTIMAKVFTRQRKLSRLMFCAASFTL